MEGRIACILFLLALEASLSQQRVSIRVQDSTSWPRNSSTEVSQANDSPSLPVQQEKQRTAKMHIVIAHYDSDNLQKTADLWLSILNMDKIRTLEPAVYIYCQNPLIEDFTPLQPLFLWGGEIKHTENLGRESHAFLLYILQHYQELPNLVLFSQDAPEEHLMRMRIERLLGPQTGFLPLALVATEPCLTDFLPGGLVQQLFAWLRKAFCPPEGIAISFMGQFIVSGERLRSVDLSTYQYMLEMLIAPSSHWIHSVHDIQHLKSPKNPMFGHVLERTWAVAFNCWQHWKKNECDICDNIEGPFCDISFCQCLDERPSIQFRRNKTEYEAKRMNHQRTSTKL